MLKCNDLCNMLYSMLHFCYKHMRVVYFILSSFADIIDLLLWHLQ